MDKEKKLGKRVHVINFNDFLKDKMPDSKPSSTGESKLTLRKASLHNLPLKAASTHNLLGDISKIVEESHLGRDLRTLMGFSSHAEMGYEKVCEEAFARSRLGELKFKKDDSNRFKDAVKREQMKELHAVFQEQNCHKSMGDISIQDPTSLLGASMNQTNKSPLRKRQIASQVINRQISEEQLSQTQRPRNNNQMVTRDSSLPEQSIQAGSSENQRKNSANNWVFMSNQQENVRDSEKKKESSIKKIVNDCNEQLSNRTSLHSTPVSQHLQKHNPLKYQILSPKDNQQSTQRQHLNDSQHQFHRKQESFPQGNEDYLSNLQKIMISPINLSKNQNRSPTRSQSNPQSKRSQSTTELSARENKIVRHFLREKSVDANKWPQLRKKLFYTLKAKQFCDQSPPSSHNPSFYHPNEIIVNPSNYQTITNGRNIKNTGQGINSNVCISRKNSEDKNEKLFTQNQQFPETFDQLRTPQTSRYQQTASPLKQVAEKYPPSCHDLDNNYYATTGRNQSGSKQKKQSADETSQLYQTNSMQSKQQSSQRNIQQYEKSVLSHQNPYEQTDTQHLYLSVQERLKVQNDNYFYNKIHLPQKSTNLPRSTTPLSSISRRPSSSKTVSVLTENQQPFHFSENHPKPIHKMMNSLCFMEMKKLKGKVSTDQKKRFNQFCGDILSIHDFLHYEKEVPLSQIAPEFHLDEINYIPRGNEGLMINMNLRKIMKTNHDNLGLQGLHLSALQKAIFNQQEKQKADQLETIMKQFVDDKKVVVTDGKDVKERVKDAIIADSLHPEEKPKDLMINYLLDEPMKIAFEKSLHPPSKFPKIRQAILEFLGKVDQLGLQMKEVFEENLFAKIPFARESSKDLFHCIKTNNIQAVNALFQHDKYLVYVYDQGMNTPLQWACKRGNLLIVQKLLQYKVDIDHLNLANKCALEYACESQNMQIAALLIAHRANPWRKGKCVLNAFLDQFPKERQLFLGAKKIHFMKLLVKPSQRDRIWEEFEGLLYKPYQ